MPVITSTFEHPSSALHAGTAAGAGAPSRCRCHEDRDAARSRHCPVSGAVWCGGPSPVICGGAFRYIAGAGMCGLDGETLGFLTSRASLIEGVVAPREVRGRSGLIDFAVSIQRSKSSGLRLMARGPAALPPPSAAEQPSFRGSSSGLPRRLQRRQSPRIRRLAHGP